MEHRIIKVFIFLFGLHLFPTIAFAQTDSLVKIERIFYDTRIVNGHSVEVNEANDLKFIIAHRFGKLNGGFYELFGLDQATLRMGLDYGLTNWLTLGIGRSSFEKTYDAYFKTAIVKQKSGKNSSPVALSFFSSISLKGQKWADTSRINYFTSRLTYAFQFQIARSFGERLSLQIMPSLIHRNLVATSTDHHDVFSLGFASKIKLSKKISINAEYYYLLPSQLDNDYRNSLAIGFDINTGGHVFQLHFGNSRGMIEKFFITETTGKWTKGDVFFGFNITRSFSL